MGLRLRFNLILTVIFALGLTVSGFVCHDLLQRHAREEVVHTAELMIEAAQAFRAYTVNEIRPLLSDQLHDTFLPQTVPAYAATQTLGGLSDEYREFIYKEATLNPTNPRNRAADWEADIVHQFRNAAERVEIVGERDTPGGRSYYIARPLQIKAEPCLYCHSTVDAAPKTLVEKYGPANGFGWKLNEVVGAQIVSVPTEVPIARANAAFRTFMVSLTAVFGFIFVAFNLMLWYLVIRPVTRLSRFADQVSQGENLDAPDFPVPSGDEIGVLSVSFNRMKKSLVKAMKMLEG
jgi:protein-histidine pros-kinase